MSFKCLIIYFLCGVASSGCSKKNFNLPEASLLPKPPVLAPAAPAAICGVQFSKSMELVKVANVAQEMFQHCRFTRAEVLKLARAVN